MQLTRTQQWTLYGCIAAFLVLMVIALAVSDALTPAFAIRSTAFADNGLIPEKYTCTGEGVFPPIRFENLPENTRSIVLYVYDQDAPRGGFDHLVLYNIPSETPVLPEGQAPNGTMQGLNSSGKQEFEPFCPATGTHRYLFTAYAVSSTYTLKNIPTIDQLKKVMKGQVLARATLTGKYKKP